VFEVQFFFFQAEDGIRDFHVTGVRRVLFRSLRRRASLALERPRRRTNVKLEPPSETRPKEVNGVRRKVFGVQLLGVSFSFVTIRSEERRVGKECRACYEPGP